MPPIWTPSPFFNDRKAGSVDILLLHYTECADTETALRWLRDPARKVSCHYVIAPDGQVHQMVAEEKRAWHAGVAYWAGADDINSRSIGIELVNEGIHETPYPNRQIQALVSLAHEIRTRHAIPRHRILGHSDVAPTRKIDPGAHFPWDQLAQAGLGLWPAPIACPINMGIKQVQAMLAQIGYQITEDGMDGHQTRAVLTAFQRHYRPARITGTPDGETLNLLTGLLSLLTCQE